MIGIFALVIAPFIRDWYLLAFKIPTEFPWRTSVSVHMFYTVYSMFIPGLVLIGIGIFLKLRRKVNRTS